jgi:COMPASS component SPP1
MPVPLGQEKDAVKAEKQEEEEDSDCPNEDDKLYCVCKTKYDEDRFMIACDRYELLLSRG